MSHECPLCSFQAEQEFFGEGRGYHRCPTCDLLFVPAQYHLSEAAARDEYDLHQPDPLDTSYQSLLNRLLRPLLPKLARGQRGLDYGAGPEPTLFMLLKGKGLICENYDPIYGPEEFSEEPFDFICASESFAHFLYPKAELELMQNLLVPGGVLGVICAFQPTEKAAFDTWHYLTDLTRVLFYSPATFEWIAAEYGFELEIHGDSVAILTKK